MRNLHTFVVLAYKESKYLEKCIQSVCEQTVKSRVVIATSTPNEYISELAIRYGLEIIVNQEKKGIGADFDFAVRCGDTELVTVAHQDDWYEPRYTEKISKAYKKNEDAIILFSDYYEIKGNKNESSNVNLRIKRLLLVPIAVAGNSRLGKRLSLMFGCSICCPAVTFVKKRVPMPLFDCGFQCDVDWHAWETLSKEKGSFVFVRHLLMGHRVHEESTTTQIINDNIRQKEDYEMFKRFWPVPIAKQFMKAYSLSEKSNKV